MLPHNGIVFLEVFANQQILNYITSIFQARKKAGHEFTNPIKFGNEPQRKNADVTMKKKILKLAKSL